MEKNIFEHLTNAELEVIELWYQTSDFQKMQELHKNSEVTMEFIQSIERQLHDESWKRFANIIRFESK